VKRGRLRVYLGYAPGVGKTYRMLQDGLRERNRGTDVVVGFVETHGRPKTAEQIQDLEVVPRKEVKYRGKTFHDMDLEALLARKPHTALIDEYAHTNCPGMTNDKRWSDVEAVLNAGIDVVTTVNIQHFESLNDVVERITGVRQRETIPDAIVRKADQIELVDISPWALRRRMSHGNIYAPEKVETALSHYFREGNLTALRELALLWLADRVEEALQDYEARLGLDASYEPDERVVVALSGREEDERLIRRAARIAVRRAGEFVAVHVASDDERRPELALELAKSRALVQKLGGRFHEIVGNDVARAIVDFAGAEKTTQLVVGASDRSRWAELTRGSIVRAIIRQAGNIDVHVISQEDVPHERAAWLPGGGAVPKNRVRFGLVLALFAPVLATLGLAQLREDFQLPGFLLVFMAVVIGVAAVGGWGPAMLSAFASFLLVNWYFTPPFYRFTIADPENLLALLMFLIVAAAISAVVARAARDRSEGRKARSEVRYLSELAEAIVSTSDPVPQFLEHIRTTLHLDSAAVLRETGGGWAVEEAAGSAIPGSPGEATDSFALGDGNVLVVSGAPLAASDRRVISAVADLLAIAMRNRQLDEVAAASARGARLSQVRGALIAAVSHDLKTPLTAIKASVTSLRQKDVVWSPEQTRDFLNTVVESADRLGVLISNLMDMSRLQAGMVDPVMSPVNIAEVVEHVLQETRASPDRVVIEVPESIVVLADRTLLGRALTNIVRNALTWAPSGSFVHLTASESGEAVSLRVVDKGPGIPSSEREKIFEAFQRLGDAPGDRGVGLGLAVARGFVEAMGGKLVPAATPGGGFTMLIRLQAPVAGEKAVAAMASHDLMEEGS
jgi:two-component system sensor histidine kinase KdpD